MQKLIKAINEHRQEHEIYYAPYTITDTKISAGVPPVKIVGFDYIFAKHNLPQVKHFPCLTGGGVFAGNRNTSGIIEIGIQQGSVSSGIFDVLIKLGIPFPIMVADAGSAAGTSGIVASACRQVETPEWRRGLIPGVIPFTFETTRLLISWGFQTIDEIE